LQVTARERELCELLALGYQNREIAAALGTSPHTVRNQLARLFDKVDVTTRAELVGRWLGQ
jgi:DNA-binding CsgD family transcriptional regulator